MKPRVLLTILIFVLFTGYSFWVSSLHGPLGFLSVLTAGGWSTQVFLDLVIAITVASTLVYRDARRRGLRSWPWMLAMATLGSIGMLGYFVYREFAGGAAADPSA